MVTRIGPQSAKPRAVYFKEWREHRNLTQEQLADRLGTTKATISRMENGKTSYNEGYLEALSEALNSTPQDLISRHPEQPSLDKLLESLNPADKNRILAVVQTLLKTGT